MRVTRNSVTEPTSGTIAHRIWEIIDRLRKPDGSVDRHNFLKRRTAKGGDQPGHSHGAQWSRWNRFHGMKGGEPGVNGAARFFPRPLLFAASGCWGLRYALAPSKAMPVPRRMARGVRKARNDVHLTVAVTA